MDESSSLTRFIERVPKAEIHVHLEGAIQPRTLLGLARRRGVELPADSEQGLEDFFEFRDFEHFVEVYLLCSRCLRDPEDFQLVVDDFLAEQERQNVLYTEAHFTISTHVANGVNADEVADALAETIAAGERDRGVQLRLVADIVRNAPFERADQTLEWALEHREDLVVALGLSGIESYPSAPFRAHFEEARRQNLKRVAHAGEQTDADDVRRVVEDCAPCRIGHGIRAATDPALLASLREARLPLEISLTSNVRLGNCDSYEDHPLAELRQAGIPLSINTDDPALFDTSLNNEFGRAASLLGLDAGGVAELSVAALDQSFLGAEEKADLRSRFDREIGTALSEVAG